MDRKTEEQIRLVGKFIPRELKARGVVREKPFEEMGQKIKERIVDNPKTPRKLREKYDYLIKQGVFEKETERIDPKVADKIERDIEGKLKAEMKSGRLKPMPRCCIVSQGRCVH